MATEQALRVIDFGEVSGLRSQTLWHAIASGVSAGAPPTLSLMRPTQAYVSIGYHRHLAEVDIDACRSAGLAVYRRMVGGGPVYLDSHQQFFQVVLPVSMVPPVRSSAIEWLLGPATEALQAAGLPAELDSRPGRMEIVVDERKVCGHGAGQIEDAVVLVGNCIERFDAAAAAATLALADPEMRAAVGAAMERFVGTPEIQVDADAFKQAAHKAYSAALGLDSFEGSLTAAEQERLAELDGLFTSPEWLEGPLLSAPRGARAVKIKGGAYVIRAEAGEIAVTITWVEGVIERAQLSGGHHSAAQLAVAARAIEGLALPQARKAAEGLAGGFVSAALATIDEKALEAGR